MGLHGLTLENSRGQLLRGKIVISQCTDYVEVKESTIPGAGRGVFAKKDIPRGTILCFYPAHGILVGFDDPDISLGMNLPSVFIPDKQDVPYFQTHNPPTIFCRETDNTAIGKRSNVIFGGDKETAAKLPVISVSIDINPNRPVLDGWVGQIVNDGAKPSSPSVQDLIQYHYASLAKVNCHELPFGPSPLLATVTSRDVQKGEELFAHYGIEYWSAKIGEAMGLDWQQCMEHEEQARAKLQDALVKNQQDIDVLEKEFPLKYSDVLKELESEFDNTTVN